MNQPASAFDVPARTDGGPAAVGVSGIIRAVGLVRMDSARIAEFRRRPSPIPEGGKPIASNLLKASDEQTVVAVAAVLAALDDQAGALGPLDGWGAVVASRYLGRSQLVTALSRFDTEGVWGVSPHLIPHYALHSPAGTLSLAIGLHGPNLGVGGGADSVTHGALTALTWLAEGRLPGVWLVLTGYLPEFLPDSKGMPVEAVDCVALAIALVPETRLGLAGPRLRLEPGDGLGGVGPIDLLDFEKRVRVSLGGVEADPEMPHSSSTIYRPHLSVPPAITYDRRTLAVDSPMGLVLTLVHDAVRGSR